MGRIPDVLPSILSPASSAGGLVSGILSNIQNEQIKAQNSALNLKADAIQATLDTATATLGDMQSSLGAIAGMQVASLATSVASIGVSAAGTALVLQRLDGIRNELREIGPRIAAFHDDWRRAELERPIDRAITQVQRVENASCRRNPIPVLQEAEAALQESFDAMSNRIDRLIAGRDIPIDALRSLLDALAISGCTQIKALFLLDEPEAARRQAQDHARKIMQHAMRMPADRLAPRLLPLEGAEISARELGRGLIETGYRLASIPPLVDSLTATGLAASSYLRAAEEEGDRPLMFMPAPYCI